MVSPCLEIRIVVDLESLAMGRPHTWRVCHCRVVTMLRLGTRCQFVMLAPLDSIVCGRGWQG